MRNGDASGTFGMEGGLKRNPVRRRAIRASRFSSAHNDCIETAICQSGGFLSEYTEDAPLFSDVFLERLLQRDRIISGFCDLFVVFECRENSATVDTAKRAMLQGKLVAAVESSRRTIRVGIEQLVDEHKIPRFRSGDLTPVQIAAQLAALVGERSKGSTPSPVADSRP